MSICPKLSHGKKTHMNSDNAAQWTQLYWH